MLKNVVTQVFGTRFMREMKRMRPIVDRIKEHEARLAGFSEEALKAQTGRFRDIISERTSEFEDAVEALREKRRYTENPARRADLTERIAATEGELNEAIQAVLDEILPEAFATVREACRRLLDSEIIVTGNDMVWDMVPYDVQLIGGIVLHQGKIAEMATGEGKTLVATMPLYLNALPGRGVHLVTVNDYLARRDAQWMGNVFSYLGLTVGVLEDTDPGSEERRAAYLADLTYGTNNEFGFDYLRDNMVIELRQRVQRGHAYAIIDEVDSVLIDEARTPLIISGPAGRDERDVYKKHNAQVAALARKQTRIVNRLVAEGTQMLDAAEEEEDQEQRWEAGLKLLAAQRGAPKNKRLLKLKTRSGVKQLIQRTEADLMREKRLPEIDEMLLYSMDEKGHTIQISEQGLDVLSPDDPEAFVVPDISEDVKRVEDDESLTTDGKREEIERLEREYAEKSEKIHVIHQLVKGHSLYERDVEYVVEGGDVIIVDEHTGRKMHGRRWSDGLHQAVEAKENVKVRGETQTLATITIQNYFRMYDKLAGMTGTAETEEGEFHSIYGLEVVVIPTNRPVRRVDHDDVIFQTKKEKYGALIEEIERVNEQGLPILVGTTSVEVSEIISRMLKRRGLAHEVLNAKQHEREAVIVQNAGQPGAITIATNMAGRGTDIKLASPCVQCDVCGIRSETPAFGQAHEEADLSRAEIKERGCEEEPPCGLQILGTERHQSRRIDRQLRGRSGRQGDPGASLFFLSLEDDLMRLFMHERVARIMDRLGVEEGEVISHPWITKSVERAQKRVETQNFDARKRLLDYDDVMNQQREVIYDLRLYALEGGEDLKGETWEMIEEAIREEMDEYVPSESPHDQWDLAGLREHLLIEYFLHNDFLPRAGEAAADPDKEASADNWAAADRVHEAVLSNALEQYRAKLDSFGEKWEHVLRFIVLSVLDEKWKDHLYDLDHLRSSIQFRSWGQKDPLVEYKKEAYEMFVSLITDIRKTVANRFFRVRIEVRPPVRPRAPQITGMSGPVEPGAGAPGSGQLPGPDAAPGPGRPAGAPGERAAREPAFSATGVAASAAVQDLTPDDTAARAALRTGRPRRTVAPATAAKGPGRNAPCPCGSGKKYKKCHGRPGG
ncbi:preprotein translocase subunit SecA [Candidatus Palauibacter sp.]|uniref:preprotein translocase subunit SecA n=1 Tax=Candidatus Palauibacter sp. TaxID=3101350 RepID=UPI003B02EA8F